MLTTILIGIGAFVVASWLIGMMLMFVGAIFG
jgi:hypothetical protein